MVITIGGLVDGIAVLISKHFCFLPFKKVTSLKTYFYITLFSFIQSEISCLKKENSYVYIGKGGVELWKS